MADRTAFFYGTLMAPEVLYRVIYGSRTPSTFQRSLTTARPALLRHHRRHKVKGADYPAIRPSTDPSASVRGTLVTGLTDADVYRLDLFEGDEYERRVVKARVVTAGRIDAAGVPGAKIEGAEEDVAAETYIWTAGEDQLESAEWDFDEFVREKMARWVGAGGESEYADVDAAAEARDGLDDPTGGRGSNGSIGKALEEQRKAESETLKNAV